MTCPHCEEKDERIAWLESELGIQRAHAVYGALRQALMGSRREAGRGQATELVAALYAAKGRPMSYEQILEAVPSPNGNEDRSHNIISVWVCTARQAFGADAISTVRGRGYQMTAAGLHRVEAILAGEAAKPFDPVNAVTTPSPCRGEATV